MRTLLSKRRGVLRVLLVLSLCSSLSCAHLGEKQKREYGILESAVTFSSDKVIGEYGDSLPLDFDGVKFLGLVKDRIPEDYYRALMRHSIEVRPKGTYYLLLVHIPEDNSVILFDYSCTPEVDGPVLLDPTRFDPARVESFDKCRD